MNTGWVEAIAVIAGIVSVWYSRKENVLVFPTGLINTTLFIYLSYRGHLLGEASVNLYYTIMSIYGWYLWTRKKEDNQTSFSIYSKIQNGQPNDWSRNLPRL